jgi:hypothetical protein
MKKLAAITLCCAGFLAACVGPDSTPVAGTLVSANLASLGAGDKTLGTAFKAPPSGIGDGDGFAPQPFVNGDGNPSVMVVGHHSTGLNIGALDLFTGEKITPLTLGLNFNTSNAFGYAQDPSTKRFYVPTSTTAGAFTYSCINGNFKPSLNEQPTLCQEVTPQSGVLAGAGSSLTADGLVIQSSLIYGAMGTSNGQLLVTCASVSNVNCAGFPKTLASDYVTSGGNNVRLQDLGGGKIAIGFNRSGANTVSAICFDLVSQITCGRIDSNATSTTSQPLGLFNNKTLIGFCAFSNEAMAQTSCADFEGQTRTVNLTTGNMASGTSGFAARMPDSGKYIITSIGGPNIECIDMAQAGASCGSTARFTGTSPPPYGSAFHLNTSTGDMCLLTYNDAKQLGIFRANTTTGGLVEDLRCFAPGGVSATWRVENPVPKVCSRGTGTRWESATITTGQLSLDDVVTTQAYGGDITILNASTGQTLGRQVFLQTGVSINVSLAALGVNYDTSPAIDIQIRVLQSNGNNLRAGYKIPAQLDVKLVCGA